ncbi:hypothetical protein TNCV_5075051 [Trichonephila clavipes]|nr:hypothetical protein TNCV_5075051 [Trichonephila clavipes]
MLTALLAGVHFSIHNCVLFCLEPPASGGVLQEVKCSSAYCHFFAQSNATSFESKIDSKQVIARSEFKPPQSRENDQDQWSSFKPLALVKNGHATRNLCDINIFITFFDHFRYSLPYAQIEKFNFSSILHSQT